MELFVINVALQRALLYVRNELLINKHKPQLVRFLFRIQHLHLLLPVSLFFWVQLLKFPLHESLMCLEVSIFSLFRGWFLIPFHIEYWFKLTFKCSKVECAFSSSRLLLWGRFLGNFLNVLHQSH